MNDLVDTNIIIESYRGREKASTFLKETPNIKCSVVTAMELIQGARGKDDQRNIEKSIKNLNIITITEEICNKALGLMKKYSLSHNLEIADALIASTAILYDMRLVTTNTKHFSYIKGLKTKKWKQD